MIEESLKGKKIAVVAMGRSQIDYHLSISHSQQYDEVWAIGSMCAVIAPDRAFIMDPATRFFDTFDAGPQTHVMRRTLPRLDVPIYSCVKDNRVPGIVLYPLEEVIQETGCAYFNNSIAYAIAYALYQEVGSINMFGADFTYKTNVHFGEMGRACCEFWLSKCMDAGMDVSIAARSPMLDTNVPEKEKLYGYHRLEDPLVVYLKDGDLKTTEFSNIEIDDEKPVGVSGRQDHMRVRKTNGLTPPEPSQY